MDGMGMVCPHFLQLKNSPQNTGGFPQLLDPPGMANSGVAPSQGDMDVDMMDRQSRYVEDHPS